MRLEDVLCNQMLGHRPEGAEIFAVGIVDSGNIVDQRVKPDIGYIVFVKGQGNPPAQAGFRPGNAQILQGLAKQGQHFITIAFRPDKVRVLLDMGNQPLLIFAHSEKIVAFLAEFRLCLVIGAFPVDQLFFRVKTFTADAVEAFIMTEIDVAGVINLSKNRLHGFDVSGIRCPDEKIV